MYDESVRAEAQGKADASDEPSGTLYKHCGEPQLGIFHGDAILVREPTPYRNVLYLISESVILLLFSLRDWDPRFASASDEDLRAGT